MRSDSKPEVQLLGQDGNAWAILGACKEAALGAGWSQEEWLEVSEKMQSGDYNNLLRVAMDNFGVS